MRTSFVDLLRVGVLAQSRYSASIELVLVYNRSV